MNSKQIWDLLEDMQTIDIKMLVSMSVIYLIKDREQSKKEIIKDIKNVCKKVGI